MVCFWRSKSELVNWGRLSFAKCLNQLVCPLEGRAVCVEMIAFETYMVVFSDLTKQVNIFNMLIPIYVVVRQGSEYREMCG